MHSSRGTADPFPGRLCQGATTWGPHVSTEDNSLPHHLCVSTRATGRGLSSSISPPAGVLLHLVQARFQGPLPSFHEPVVVPGCPQGHRPCSGTPQLHTNTPCILESNPKMLSVFLYVDISLPGIGASCLFKTGSCRVARTGLELVVLLPLLPEG